MTEEQVRAYRTLSRFALGLGVLGAVLFVFGIYFLFISNESLSWPSVEGKVERTEVNTHVGLTQTSSSVQSHTSVQYYVSVHYKYEVDDKTYFSSRYSLGEADNASPFYAERSLAEKEASKLFPAGSRITVYYDPENPENALIAPGWNWGTFVPLLLGLFLGGAGLFFYFNIRAPQVSSEK